MLKISKMADYGTIILTAMASDPERLRSAAEMGEVTGLPAPSVSKILKILVREGLVLSQRGARGGYRLSRPAEEISTAWILDAIDGPIGLTECSSAPGICSHETNCRVRANWQTVSRAIRQALERITLRQMVQPAIGPRTLAVLYAQRTSAGSPGRKAAGVLP